MSLFLDSSSTVRRSIRCYIKNAFKGAGHGCETGSDGGKWRKKGDHL